MTQIADKAAVAALRARAPDLKESLEIGRDNHATLRNAWPDRFDGAGAAFRARMVAFFAACQGVHVALMQALARGLGLPAAFFDGAVAAADNNLRLLHYPRAPARAGTVRAGEHTDYGTVTLLFQDARGGLQVRGPRGGWVDAAPIAGTLVVNAGDLLARWSNGIVASTEHRVVEPPGAPVDGEYPARYSCAWVLPGKRRCVDADGDQVLLQSEFRYGGGGSAGHFLGRKTKAVAANPCWRIP